MPRKVLSAKAGIIDLFSGVGGLSLGAARAGFSVEGAVELDPHAMAAHKVNFRNTKHLAQDVASLNGSILRDKFDLKNGRLAGIIGGPPCQGFSSMGRRQVSDPRNNLFSDFFRIVSEARPKFFLAENVPGILGAQYKSIRERALSYVEKNYEILPPMKIRASDYGAPTTRTRVFFIGYLKDELESLEEQFFLPSPQIQEVTVKEALR